MDRQHWEAEEPGKGLAAAAKRISELEDALERERAQLGAIFASPELFAIKDRESVYRVVNPAFCSFLGKSESGIVGKSDRDLFPAEEAARHLSGDEEVFRTGKSVSSDASVSGKAGKFWFQVLRSPVLDKSGRVSGVLCSFRDIGNRKKKTRSNWSGFSA